MTLTIRKCFGLVLLIILVLKISPIYCYDQYYTSESNNIYYVNYDLEYTWFQALQQCIERNMTLVKIGSEEKTAELNNVLEGGFLWIGGIIIDNQEHNRIWISTGERIEYTNWKLRSSIKADKSDVCVYTNSNSWEDINCDSTLGFICEYKNHQNCQKEEIRQKEEQLVREFDEKLQQELDKLREIGETVKKELTEREEQLQFELDEKLQEELEKQQEIDNLKNEKLQQELEKQQEIDNLKNENLQQQLEKQQEIDNLKNEIQIQEQKLDDFQQMVQKLQQENEESNEKDKVLQTNLLDQPSLDEAQPQDEEQQLKIQLQQCQEQQSRGNMFVNNFYNFQLFNKKLI